MLELTIQNILCLSLLLYSRRITLHVTILFCLFIFVNILGCFFCSIVYSFRLRSPGVCDKANAVHVRFSWHRRPRLRSHFLLGYDIRTNIRFVLFSLLWCPCQAITLRTTNSLFITMFPFSLFRPSINLFDIVIVIIIITHRTIVFRFHAPIDLHTFRSISAFWDSNNIKYFLVLL